MYQHFTKFIKTFGRMVRGNVQEAPLWSLFLVVKRDCNETPMLGIRIVLSFLFLFVRIGISYGNPWPSSILALVAGWKSGAFRCSDVLLCPMSGRTAAIAEVKAIQRVLLQTRMQCDFFFNNDHSVPYAFFFQGLYVLHYINIILTSVNFSRHDHGYINAYRPKGWIYPPPQDASHHPDYCIFIQLLGVGGTPYQELLQFFLSTAEMPGTATFLLVYGQFPVMQRIVAVQGCGSPLSSSWHEETSHQVRTPKQICIWINCERCQGCAMVLWSP